MIKLLFTIAESVTQRAIRRQTTRAAEVAPASVSSHDVDMALPPRPRRRRGRPPNSEGRVTSQALLDAATEACAEWGFDGTTLARIAERAGLSPTAIYNHYPSKEELLYAAAVQGLEQISALAEQLAAERSHGGPIGFAMASAYLRPEMRSTRRLLAEIHLASNRDARLAELLADWHRRISASMVTQLPPGDPDPEATVKMGFLLLLGLCHVDDLTAVETDPAALAARAEHLVVALGTVDRSPDQT